MGGVLLALFIVAGAAHMTLFKRNMARGKKFIFSGIIFGMSGWFYQSFLLLDHEKLLTWAISGFCMTRILATVFRIIWSVYPLSTAFTIVATVMFNAGTVLLYIVNLFLVQRAFRAHHPYLGWSKPISLAVPVLTAILIGSVIALIVSSLTAFFLFSSVAAQVASTVQRLASAIFVFSTLLPGLVCIATTAIPSPSKGIDDFGAGTLLSKWVIIFSGSIVLTLSTTYRATTAFLPSEPSDVPLAPWRSKPAFYTLTFLLELLVTIFWLVTRIDRRFYVRDGAKGPYSYGTSLALAGVQSRAGVGTTPAEFECTEFVREQMDDQRPLPSSCPSPKSSRAELTSYPSRIHSRVEARSSWGGLSASGTAERARVLSFSRSCSTVGSIPALDGPVAVPVEILGADQELGWDPITGDWALRPASRACSRKSVGAAL